MKNIIFVLLLSLIIAFQGNSRNGTVYPLHKQIITSEIIRNTGLTRLSDVLFLTEDWDIYSIGGFKWQVSPNGLCTFQQQDWIVMLDGQRMDINLINIKSLNMLPVSIDQIDSVVIISTPQIYKGEFTERGLIHFYTSRPKNGLSLYGRNTIGNETGDPGPYAYTQYATENVDRLGPDYSFYLGFGRKRWFVRTGLNVQNHYSTDPLILDRNKNTSRIFFRGQMVSPSLRLGFNGFSGKHEIFAAYSTSNKNIFTGGFGSDRLYFKPLAREIPVQSSFSHTGINGDVTAAKNLSIHYQVKYSNIKLEKPVDYLNTEFDWKLNNFLAEFEAAQQKPHYQGKLGIGYQKSSLNTGYNLDKNNFSLGKIYGEINFSFSKNTKQSIGAYCVIADKKFALKTQLTNYWRTGSRSLLTSLFSYSQRLIEEDNNLWFWTARGYGFLKENNVEYEADGKFEKSKLFTGDITWNTNFSQILSLKLCASYRLFRDLYLESQDILLDPFNNPAASPIQIYTRQKGQVLGCKAAAKIQLTPQLKQQISYRYSTDIEGSKIFREMWQALPKHQICYTVIYIPVESFALSAGFRSISSSEWIEYKSFDARPQTNYSSIIKSKNLVDAALFKWFWKKRLWASLAFHNIFNDNEIYHPFSSRFNLRWHVQIGFSFEGIGDLNF